MQSIVTRTQLLAQGSTPRRIAAAVSAGTLTRIRQGYYARPGADEALVRAVQIGGVATGITALPSSGIWTPPSGRLFVMVRRNAGRLREVGHDVVLHWDDPLRIGLPGPARFQPVAPLPTVLAHALADASPAFAVAIGDSALFTRAIGRSAFDRVVAGLPRAIRRRIAHRFDGRSESGIESIARFLLAEEGIDAEIQVLIDAVGRVDLLIDGWLIIELDGNSHADPKVMRQDRYRDAMAVRGGRRTLRFSYDDVMLRWPHVLRTIRIALAEGRPAFAA